MATLSQIAEQMLPFAESLGIEFVSSSPEKIVAELTVREDLCNRPAVLHGGAIMAFADTLGATGTILNLPVDALSVPTCGQSLVRVKTRGLSQSTLAR